MEHHGNWNMVQKSDKQIYKLHVLLHVLRRCHSCPAKLKKPPGFSGYLRAVEAKLSLTELRIGWSQRAANPTAMPMPASSPCVNKGARRPPFFNMFLWYTPNAMATTTIWGCLLKKPPMDGNVLLYSWAYRITCSSSVQYI